MNLPALKSVPRMPSKYSIRLASPEHLRAIPDIQVAAASVFAEADVPLDIRYRISSADVLQAAQKSGHLWIAADYGNRVIGYAMVEIVDGLAHLDDLDVHPEHAKQGIGSTLLQVVIDWVRREDFPAMTLVTFRHLVWNAPFYEKFGFKELNRAALSPDLRAMIEDEIAAGLSEKNRIAMQLLLAG